MTTTPAPDLPDDRRRCRSCGADMRATRRSDGPWHRGCVYTCPDCGYGCDLEDAGSLGYSTTITLIACAVLGLFVWTMRWRGLIEEVVIVGFVAVMLSYLGYRWWKHLVHPFTLPGSNIGAMGIAEILLGLLRPIILIAAVLAVAALIGLATFDG